MSEQKPREKHLLYLDKSTPEEFINAELMDWIYLVGDISTPYELDFVRQFGHAFKTRDNQMRKEGAKAERERLLTRKNIDIIRQDCIHPYWDKCGGLQSCQYFDERNTDCKFDIKVFIEHLRSEVHK